MPTKSEILIDNSNYHRIKKTHLGNCFVHERINCHEFHQLFWVVTLSFVVMGLAIYPVLPIIRFIFASFLICWLICICWTNFVPTSSISWLNNVQCILSIPCLQGNLSLWKQGGPILSSSGSSRPQSKSLEQNTFWTKYSFGQGCPLGGLL